MKGRRVLVLAIRAIGDVVLVTPILRILKKVLPAAYLAVVVDGPSAEVLRSNPNIDRIIAINRKASHALQWNQWLKEFFCLLSDIRSKRFDIAVDLFSGPRSALLAWLCGATDRYSEDFRTSGRGFLYNHPVSIERDGRHLVEQKLDLIRSLVGTVEKDEAYLEVFLTGQERERAKAILAQFDLARGKRIGLVTSSGSIYRNWPCQNFAAVGDQLAQDYGAKIILFGGPNDVLVCQRVSDLMTSKCVNLCGKTSIRELIALFAELDLIISNVTGPMHLAVATNIPKVIGIYGAADTVQYAPWGLSGTMVTKALPTEAYWQKVDYSRDFEYLRKVSVQDVVKQVQKVMHDW